MAHDRVPQCGCHKARSWPPGLSAYRCSWQALQPAPPCARRIDEAHPVPAASAPAARTSAGSQAASMAGMEELLQLQQGRRRRSTERLACQQAGLRKAADAAHCCLPSRFCVVGFSALTAAPTPPVSFRCRHRGQEAGVNRERWFSSGSPARRQPAHPPPVVRCT